MFYGTLRDHRFSACSGTPPNIEPELLEKAFGIIDQAMDDYENGRIPDEVLKYKAGW
jgi:hypothetical protein